MLKITPQAFLQFSPLDDAPDFDLHLPPQWTGDHCALRLCEGFKTLRQLPIRGAALGFSNAWPIYAYEWQDLLAQAGGEAEALRATQREQNRVRLQPSLREVTRCEAVISWGGRYLRAFDHLLVATNAVALAHALGRDAGWCTRRRDGYADTWRQRHDKGCAIIADGLIRDRVPVF